MSGLLEPAPIGLKLSCVHCERTFWVDANELPTKHNMKLRCPYCEESMYIVIGWKEAKVPAILHFDSDPTKNYPTWG